MTLSKVAGIRRHDPAPGLITDLDKLSKTLLNLTLCGGGKNAQSIRSVFVVID